MLFVYFVIVAPAPDIFLCGRCVLLVSVIQDRSVAGAGVGSGLTLSPNTPLSVSQNPARERPATVRLARTQNSTGRVRHNYEKLGAFYLGKAYDLGRGAVDEELLLYDSKDLTTHAVCVGMTGSGKTGLCLSLLEEAAINGIPAIVIDPKGDLGNLALAFPDLDADSFLPWIDESAAVRAGMTSAQYATDTARR